MHIFKLSLDSFRFCFLYSRGPEGWTTSDQGVPWPPLAPTWLSPCVCVCVYLYVCRYICVCLAPPTSIEVLEMRSYVYVCHYVCICMFLGLYGSVCTFVQALVHFYSATNISRIAGRQCLYSFNTFPSHAKDNSLIRNPLTTRSDCCVCSMGDSLWARQVNNVTFNN